MTCRPLVYYTTAHGYGHSARTCDILRAVLRMHPDIPVIVVSGVEEAFFSSRLDETRYTWRHGAFDVGLVQIDSVRADVDATLEVWRELWPRREAVLDEELAFLRRIHAGLVVSDIPALPLQAAGAAGIPSIAVGNFGWNWIYAEYLDRDPLWGEIVDWTERAYRDTDLLLRLPFSEPMSAFPRRRDIPLVAEPGRARRDWIARRTGADPGKPWYLLSFSTLEWDADALRRVAALTAVEFFTLLPLAWDPPNIHPLDRHEIGFTDVVASVDAVISKPGFGILSECAVNDKPLVYVEREDFIEYPILELGLRRHLRYVHLPAASLYRGELGDALDAVRSAPPPRERSVAGGAELAARTLAEFLGG